MRQHCNPGISKQFAARTAEVCRADEIVSICAASFAKTECALDCILNTTAASFVQPRLASCLSVSVMVTDESTTSKHIMFFLFAADKTNTDSDSVEGVCPMHDIDLHPHLNADSIFCSNYISTAFTRSTVCSANRYILGYVQLYHVKSSIMPHSACSAVSHGICVVWNIRESSFVSDTSVWHFQATASC